MLFLEEQFEQKLQQQKQQRIATECRMMDLLFSVNTISFSISLTDLPDGTGCPASDCPAVTRKFRKGVILWSRLRARQVK
jgi:hypothetical protein